MIEMVPLCFRVVDDLSRPPAHENTLLLDGEKGGGGAEKKGGGKRSLEGSMEVGSMEVGRGGDGSEKGGRGGEEEEEGRREMVRRRLEGAGYRVGQGIVERFVDLYPLLSVSFSARGGGRVRWEGKQEGGVLYASTTQKECANGEGDTS